MAVLSRSSLALLALLAGAVCLANGAALTGLGTLGTENGGSCGFTGGFPSNATLVTGFSEAIYGGGSVCGGCFLVQCVNGLHCKLGGRVVVTATNECMATNSTDPCVKPKAALNLQPVAYDYIATSRAPGVVGITWLPIPCIRVGGVQFMVTTGDKYYLAVLIQNVAGPGALNEVHIKAGVQPLTPMTRSFGAVWQVNNYDITGASISLLLVGYNGEKLFIKDALPADWEPQTVYQSPLNFDQKPPAKK